MLFSHVFYMYICPGNCDAKILPPHLYIFRHRMIQIALQPVRSFRRTLHAV